MATNHSAMQIQVTSEQLSVLSKAGSKAIELRDATGNLVGYAAPVSQENHGVTAEDIALVRARMKMNQRQYTTQEVLAILASLETKQ